MYIYIYILTGNRVIFFLLDLANEVFNRTLAVRCMHYCVALRHTLNKDFVSSPVDRADV